MSIGWFDISIIFVYFIGMGAIGFYFSRKNTSTEEYFVGGRAFPGWVVGLSMVGTSISSITFVAYPADSFKISWIRYIPNLALPVGILVAALVFIPFFRRSRCTSAYEYLEERFGQPVRVYASISFVISQIVRTSLILYLISILVHEMTGLAPQWCILATGICVSLYTVAGGIDAVLWTDVIQTMLLVVGGIICVIAVVIKVPGGLGEIFSMGWETGKLSFSNFTNGEYSKLPFGFSFTKKTFVMLWFLGLSNWLTEYGSNQMTVQRYLAAKSNREARKALAVTLFSSLPIWAFYMFVGTALYVFFQYFPVVEATEVLQGSRKAEQILPFFILNYLPAGIIGIIIAAALAAAMSSLSSSINSIATVSVVDLYRRYIAKEKNDKHHLKASWVSATLASVFMIAGALMLVKMKTRTLQDTSLAITSVLTAGLIGIYLVGFFTKLCDWRAICVGILCTTLFALWVVLSRYGWVSENLHIPFDLYYTAIFGNLIMVFACVIAGVVFRRTDPLRENMTAWSLRKK